MRKCAAFKKINLMDASKKHIGQGHVYHCLASPLLLPTGETSLQIL